MDPDHNSGRIFLLLIPFFQCWESLVPFEAFPLSCHFLTSLLYDSISWKRESFYFAPIGL